MKQILEFCFLQNLDNSHADSNSDNRIIQSSKFRKLLSFLFTLKNITATEKCT